MQNTTILKYGQRVLAIVLFGISVFYVIEAIRRNQQSINPDIFFSIIPQVLIAALLWAGALFILALGWARLMLWKHRLQTDDLICIYGLTNIAKYLPGNIFHFAARQAAARTLDISQKTAAAATSVEIVSLIVAAMIIGCLSLVLFADPEILANNLTLVFDANRYPLALAISIAVLAVTGVVLWRSQLARNISKQLSEKLLIHLAHTIVFFLIVAATTVLLATGLGVTFGQSLLIAGAFQVAWSIGFVLPGASAGLGVREAAFIFVVGMVSDLPEHMAIQIALSMRVINIFGDLINAGICFYLRARKAPANAP